MEYEGEYLLPTTREVVWELLMNPDVLAKATPGIQRLEPLEEPGKYKAHYDVRLGAVAGQFEGFFHVKDIVEGDSFTLQVYVKGAPGTMDVVGKIVLEPNGEGTLVRYSGKARATDKLAKFGQRVLKSSARMFTRQFFKKLEKEFIKPLNNPKSESKMMRRFKEWKSRSK